MEASAEHRFQTAGGRRLWPVHSNCLLKTYIAHGPTGGGGGVNDEGEDDVVSISTEVAMNDPEMEAGVASRVGCRAHVISSRFGCFFVTSTNEMHAIELGAKVLLKLDSLAGGPTLHIVSGSSSWREHFVENRFRQPADKLRVASNVANELSLVTSAPRRCGGGSSSTCPIHARARLLGQRWGQGRKNSSSGELVPKGILFLYGYCHTINYYLRF